MSIPVDHPYEFDPTYGFSLEGLCALRPPEEPVGFAAFWRARYERALGVDTAPRLSAGRGGHPGWIVHDITYASTDDFRIGGWLLLPEGGKIGRGLVVGHGYGGREQPDFGLPLEETAVLFPCFRGLSRSRQGPISEDPAWHVLHDIDKLDRYILGGCVEDLWTAVSALIALYPELDGKIGYTGTSFGGGIGALAIPFDPRIDRGHLVVPTFSNIPLWLTLPTVGSGNSVQNYARVHPEVRETLKFFDAATAASRIGIPMLVAVARFDPAVAPPCQFSVANALPVTKQHEIVVLDAGHFDYDGMQPQQALLAEKVRRLFKVE
jgi:cephalosporin-C deacetylase